MLASIIYNYGKFCDDFKSTLKLGAYHITRERLATMTGIPIQTLADWEQHRHSPVRVNDLQNIAIALDCYLNDFVVDGKHI